MTIREHDIPAEPVDAGRILAAIRGEDRAISRRTGLYLLSVRPDLEDRVGELVRVLEDRSEAPALRRDAARYLGRIDVPDSVAALERALEVEEPLVRAAAAKALGSIGSRETLERIEAVRGRLEGAVAAAATAAARLIAHRFGVEGYRVPGPPEGEFLELDERASRELEVGGHAHAHGDPGHGTEEHGHGEHAHAHGEPGHGAHGEPTPPTETPPLGFDADWSAAVPIRCGPREMVLLLERSVLAEPGRALERPWLVGTVGHWHPQDGLWMPIYHLLTDPVDGAAEIAGTTTHGKLAFAGTARLADSTAAFAVRGVPGFGTLPLDVAGRASAGGIELERARVGTRVARKRVTVPG